MTAKVIRKRMRAVVEKWLYSATAPCHGHRSLTELPIDGAHKRPEIPGWDLPPGTEVEIDVTVRVVKLGRESRKRCQNPWPAHHCDDGIHFGPYGTRKRRVPGKARAR